LEKAQAGKVIAPHAEMGSGAGGVQGYERHKTNKNRLSNRAAASQ
jgi:hypothetical protein